MEHFLFVKKIRIGRNPKTKKETIIKERNVVLFKPSREFKEFVNLKNNDQIENAYKTIGEVAKILDLKGKSGQKTPTHTIRFWKQNLNKSDQKY